MVIQTVMPPWEVEALVQKAYRMEKRGDVDGAAAVFTCLIEACPGDEDFLIERGRLCWAVKDFSGAMADLDQAIRVNPQAAWAYANRARVKEEAGDVEGAAEDYEDAVFFNPESYEIRFARSLNLATLGQGSEALDEYRAARELVDHDDCSGVQDIREEVVNRIRMSKPLSLAS